MRIVELPIILAEDETDTEKMDFANDEKLTAGYASLYFDEYYNLIAQLVETEPDQTTLLIDDDSFVIPMTYLGAKKLFEKQIRSTKATKDSDNVDNITQKLP